MDNEGTNVALFLVENNKMKLLKFLVDRIRQKNCLKENKIDTMIREWINERNIRGYNCLYYAIVYNNMEMLIYLESLGADIYQTFLNGNNLLHCCIALDNMVGFLHYSKFLNLNQQNQFGQTPLIMAVKYCYYEYAVVLLRKKALIDI